MNALPVIAAVAVLLCCGIALGKGREKTFACPNCGHIFKKKQADALPWWGALTDKKSVRCPQCNIRDFCKVKDE